VDVCACRRCQAAGWRLCLHQAAAGRQEGTAMADTICEYTLVSPMQLTAPQQHVHTWQTPPVRPIHKPIAPSPAHCPVAFVAVESWAPCSSGNTPSWCPLVPASTIKPLALNKHWPLFPPAPINHNMFPVQDTPPSPLPPRSMPCPPPLTLTPSPRRTLALPPLPLHQAL
jgi:hypothetical protein